MFQSKMENIRIEKLKNKTKFNKDCYRPELESNLISNFLDYLNDYLQRRSKNYRLEREVGVGRRVADIVLFMDPNRQNNFNGFHLSAHESVVIADLRSSKVQKDKYDLKKLRNLLNSKIIRLVGSYLELNDSFNKDRKIIAFEAKLKNWKQALAQAKYYQYFANKSYVVLPEGLSCAALKSIECFKKEKVGLIVVSKVDFKEVLKAKRVNLVPSWRREYISSRFHPEEAM